MSDVARPDGRQPDQLRPVKIELGVNVHAEGSCLIEMGRTRVWITASVEDRVPSHRRGSIDDNADAPIRALLRGGVKPAEVARRLKE